MDAKIKLILEKLTKDEVLWISRRDVAIAANDRLDAPYSISMCTAALDEICDIRATVIQMLADETVFDD